MIDPEKRKALFLLYEEGMSIRDISCQLRVSRNTVRVIIKQKGCIPETVRGDRIQIDPGLLLRLHGECRGFIQRIHEKLAEEENIHVGYSTLTRMVRELGLGDSQSKRCARIPDEPGAEMQHDTSTYKLPIGDTKLRIIGSLLYFRYSKRMYVQFYRSFDRFRMKCFFHEALTHFGYTAPVCVIDNTNLARLRGTGKNAVMVLEMEQFGRQYGFRFLCHEVGHANRKAGNERSFYTVETNFFPGRTFENMEDLNRQAFEWATVRMANRPVSRTGMIPAKAFEHEQQYLRKLPPFVPAPYRCHTRCTDQYGYISFDGNFYWVPGTTRGEVTVLEYQSCIKIYQKRTLLAEYSLPPEGLKNQLFSPKGMPNPHNKPKYRKKPTFLEEKKLRALAPEVDAYLQFVLKPMGKPKHRVIRELYRLHRKLALPVFVKTITRALKYRIEDMQTVERIALMYIGSGSYELPAVEIDEEFKNREAYRDGRLTDDVDLSIYEELLNDDHE